jgi:CPA1 family monovalent cation:H+ antiporter
VLLLGILIGSIHWVPRIALAPRLVLFLFLPVILFDAAFKLDSRRLLPVIRRAAVLGLPGAVLAAGALAWALLVLRFPAPIAFALAAALAATDPVSVFAVLRGVNLPAPLRTLLEAESLVNDGTAVVLFAVALEAVKLGRIDWPRAGLRFLFLYAGGVVLGLIWGMFFVWLFQRLEDPWTAVAISVAVAYGGYLGGEFLRVSGILVVVVAGLLLGSTRRVRPLPRERINEVWDFFAFGANTLIFLLIGLQFRLGTLPGQLGAILAVTAAALAARALVILVFSIPVRTTSRVERMWRPILIWGGLRGALTLALVLSLPVDFPYRERILAITVGFVLFSLIVQGLTLRPLIQRLPIPPVLGYRLARE